MNDEDAATAILERERRALDRWAAGDPVGYFEGYGEDVTYFDDIGAQQRMDGLAALRGYAESLVGNLPKHSYELIDPKVQVYDDMGIVTMGYAPFAEDGTPLTRWKATVVYRRYEDDWRVVHGHWSMLKDT